LRSDSGAQGPAAGGVHQGGRLADAGGGVSGADVAGFVGGLLFAAEEPAQGGGRLGVDGSEQVEGGGVVGVGRARRTPVPPGRSPTCPKPRSVISWRRSPRHPDPGRRQIRRRDRPALRPSPTARQAAVAGPCLDPHLLGIGPGERRGTTERRGRSLRRQDARRPGATGRCVPRRRRNRRCHRRNPSRGHGTARLEAW